MLIKILHYQSLKKLFSTKDRNRKQLKKETVQFHSLQSSDFNGMSESSQFNYCDYGVALILIEIRLKLDMAGEHNTHSVSMNTTHYSYHNSDYYKK